MIKNYNIFRLYEKISLNDTDVIDIIKSLETGENKDNILKKLVNNIDNQGRSILMSAVKSNDEKLIDYILTFNPDINHKNKYGENVLFYCKNIKIFKKIYALGADPLAKSKNIDRNILLTLANKKIFNVDLYQQLIGDGVNIKEVDVNGFGMLVASIQNNKILQFLIKKGIDINGSYNGDQHYLSTLFSYMKYSKRKYYDIFDTLFKNGLKIKDIDTFITNLLDLDMTYRETEPSDKSLNFIDRYKSYLGSDFFIKVFYDKTRYFSNFTVGGNKHNPNLIYIQKLLDITESPELYFTMKKYFREKFSEYFDLDKYEWLDAAGRYNL